jgi:long-chain fatty acid transport protein
MTSKEMHYVIGGMLMTAACNASAAGFALIEQNGSGMGNAYAGAAAIAEDASTIFFNPAGMTYLPDSQLVMAAHAIQASAKFDNQGSTTPLGATTGGDGGDAGGWAFVPNFFYARAITDSIRLGIGVSAPFGLKTEYDDDWVGRYQAIKSELKTVNINPSIAFKASDRFSIGFGISAMRAQAELTNAVNFGALLGFNQLLDGKARLEGDDWGFGWNAGVLFQPRSDTRIGLAYRSQVHHELEGDVTFSGVPAPLSAFFPNGNITADLTTPSTFSASLFHQVDDQWDVVADATWIRWSNFEELRVVRDNGSEVSNVPEKWENTMRYSIGASYRHSDAVKLRAGLAYDESPISDRYRTPRIPDEDRIWLSLGASYRFSATGSLDVGYTHIFVQEGSLDKTNDTSVAALRDRLTGEYDSDVNILSVQYTHTF